MPHTIRSFDCSRHSFVDNSKQALADYLQLGYHIEPNVFSQEECDTLIQAAHTLEDAKNHIFRPNMMPHKQHTVFLTAMKAPFIVKTISTLISGEAVGLQSEFFYCKPGTRGFSLHQDNFYVEANYGVFVSAWIALTDTYAEKGGLIIYPMSHETGALPIKKLNIGIDQLQDPNANNEETIVPEKYIQHNIGIKKGSVLFIHGHLVHGSHTNSTDEWRYVLLCTYIRSGEEFRAGRYAKREMVQIK